MPDEFDVIYFKQEDVLSYLQKHPDKFYDKKFHELLVGWIIAHFLGEEERKSMYIGFPLKAGGTKPSKDDQRTMDWLLNNYNKAIDDSEVDICIGNKALYVKFQITRFFCPAGRKPTRRLADLIHKKCQKYMLDPKLYLVVSVESRPNISIEEITRLLTKTKIPFGGIILIAKASNERGHFTYYQLYPKPFPGKKVRLPLPV